MSRRAKNRDGRATRGWLPRLVVVINLAGICTALSLAWLIQSSYGAVQDISRVQLAGTLTPVQSTQEGGDRVLNVLLVGSDSTVGLDPDDPINTGRGDTRNGDVIIIAHLDERNSTAALLSIPRDLWVPIAGENRDAKINNAFAVGGPVTLIETIEENFDIPIHHYVNVDFAGFQGLVDAVDEVEVYFDAPMRDFNTSTNLSQTGFQVLSAGCQPLNGEIALRYVRSRYMQRQDADGNWVSEQASDLNRIKRQQDFVRRLVGRAVDLGARNPFVFDKLVDATIENVAIDQELTPAFLLNLAQAFDSFDAEELETYSLPSRFGWVGTSSVLFVQDDDADPALHLFRGALSTDPSTVNVVITNSPKATGAAQELAEVLQAAGFDASGPTSSPLEHVGVQLRHGPDGAGAAQLVAAALGGTVELVEVPTLVARNVVVSVGEDDGLSDGTGADGDAGAQDPAFDDTVPPSPDHDTSCL